MSVGSARGAELTRRHLPALDGLRAIAVVAVILYHLGLGWAGGGYLGVDLFFVLSGFLITGLLVEERSAKGTISLRRFYGRRARRLFPALGIVLLAIVVYAALGGPNIDPTALPGDVLGTLFYVANWHLIAANNSYFAPLATPSPLEHTWSLAIEEQFYVVWPLLLMLIAKFGRRNWPLVVAGAIALASAVDMAWQAHVSGDITRAYFGTDTRAFELMIGALLALWMERPRQAPPRTLRLAGAGSLVLILAGVVTLGGPPHWMFDGGFVGIAVLAAVVIASVTSPDSGLLGTILSRPVLQWIGRVSYGLYLWHWPIVVFVTTGSTGLSGALVDMLRVLLTVGLASASYYVVERPIREGRLPIVRGVRGVAVTGVAALVIVLALSTISVPTSAASPAHSGSYPGVGPSVAGSGGLTGQEPIKLPASVGVDEAHPLRVLVFGDSITELSEIGIQVALDSTRVVRVSEAAFPGFGISPNAPDEPPPWAKPWHGALRFLKGLIQQQHPQLLIGGWSWDSAYAKAFPSTYRRLVDSTLSQLLAPGDGVLGILLLQTPPMGPIPASQAPTLKQEAPLPPGAPRTANEYQAYELRSAGVPTWNRIVSQAPRAFPGKVMYLPIAASLELHGRYTTWLPPVGRPGAPHSLWLRVRMIDDVHLCPVGVVRVGAAVLEDMRQVFHLPGAVGKWWHANVFEIYGQPPSDCPDDHPPP